MTVLRNPFSQEIQDKLKVIVEPAVEQIKNNINVNYVNNAATFISAEALESKKKLDESHIDQAGEETNLKDFSPFLEHIKSPAENQIIEIVQEIYSAETVNMSGSFYYPDSGFMGWHTNCSDPCKTVLYIVYADEDQKSFFRYEDEEGNIITDYDDKGLTIRQFELKGEKPYFWHCVGSTCNRFSFGFRIYQSRQDAIATARARVALRLKP